MPKLSQNANQRDDSLLFSCASCAAGCASLMNKSRRVVCASSRIWHETNAEKRNHIELTRCGARPNLPLAQSRAERRAALVAPCTLHRTSRPPAITFCNITEKWKKSMAIMPQRQSLPFDISDSIPFFSSSYFNFTATLAATYCDASLYMMDSTKMRAKMPTLGDCWQVKVIFNH